MLVEHQQEMEVDNANGTKKLKGHRLSLTCVCVDSKDEYAFSGSKDGSIIKWRIRTKKILHKINSVSPESLDESKKSLEHHVKGINCIAISSDDKFLATGGWDKVIKIWSPENLAWIHSFKQHRQEVTALAFRLDHPTLYSASADKSVMLWTLEDEDNKSFVEALYGHESPITSIDCTKRERVLTSGGRDQSIRVWKIVEQAQTVFSTKHESVDIVRYVNDKIFISGGEDGAINVWTMMHRTPIYTQPAAHGPNATDQKTLHDMNGSRLYYWITSLGAFALESGPAIASRPRKKRKTGDGNIMTTEFDHDDDESGSNDDDEDKVDSSGSKSGPIALVASGSCDSSVRIWKMIKKGSKISLELHQTITCPGFINDLRFTKDGSRLIAACGQESRFGRWWKLRAPNTMKVFEVEKIK